MLPLVLRAAGLRLLFPARRSHFFACAPLSRQVDLMTAAPARPPLAVAASSSDGFPSRADRNRLLSRRMQEALGGDAELYGAVKQAAGAFRTGQASAEDLCDAFFAVFGEGAVAEELYYEMADLLPTASQRVELLSALQQRQLGAQDAAAGWQEWQAPPEARAAAEAALAAREQQQLNQQQRQHQTQHQQQRQQQQAGGQRSRATANASSASAAGPAVAGTAAAAGAGRGAAGGPGVLYWLRQDLRLHDNPALVAAAAAAQQRGGKLTLVYVHSPAEDGDLPPTGTSWRPGGASLLWLHHALSCLDADLRFKYGPGAGIVFLRGPVAPALLSAAAALKAGAIHWNRRYEPAMMETDRRVQRELEAQGLSVESHNALLLREPWEVRVDMGKWKGHFGTLTPFLSACESLGRIPNPVSTPARLQVAAAHAAAACGGVTLEGLGLARMPRRKDGSIVDWAAPIRASWDFSESAALQLLQEFVSGPLAKYEAQRGLADGRAVSRLSPYLHFGQLSPRLMVKELERAKCRQVSKTFWRRLVWRDLAYWQLWHWPRMASTPIREHYAGMAWADDPGSALLRAWQRGQTGFPLVDAGMRQLWATGWMQQNARMAAACFLTEYLGIPWVAGAAWFHDTLLDADLAINSMMWQNAGKSGTDQWNFTVLPTSRAMDPDGSFIRKWVPELARLPPKHCHEPWAAPPAVLAAAGVQLGVTYPHRITKESMQALRSKNTAAIRAARTAAPGWVDGNGYDVVLVPKGATVGHDGKRMRVFTKPEYRSASGAAAAGDGEEQEWAEGRGNTGAGSSTRPKQRAGGTNGRAAAKRGRSGGGNGREAGAKLTAGQRTMLEYAARAGDL